MSMRVTLDTNICIALMNRTSRAARRRLRHWAAGDVVISTVTYYELRAGALNSGRPKANLENLRDFRNLFPVIDLNEDDAAAAADIRQFLQQRGTPIGSYDILIAGQAISRSLIVATHNVKEFSRIPDLVVEDWLQEN